MKTLIEAFPQNILDAAKFAEGKYYNKTTNEIRNILICGLGGSESELKSLLIGFKMKLKSPF